MADPEPVAAGPSSPTVPALTPSEIELLLVLAEASGPIGARLACRHLADRGVELSEATVSRMLQNLDDAGHTQRHGAKGRTLTTQGRALGRVYERDRRRNAELAVVLDIRSVEQLLDLLHARRGVERQIARAAALRANSQDVDELQAVVYDYQARRARGENPRHLGIEFHRQLARSCRNQLLVTLADIVLAEELDYLEEILDVINHGHGTLDQAADEHTKLVQALRARDPATAEHLIDEHLARLIDEVEFFAESGRAEMFPHLVALAQNR